MDGEDVELPIVVASSMKRTVFVVVGPFASRRNHSKASCCSFTEVCSLNALAGATMRVVGLMKTNKELG